MLMCVSFSGHDFFVKSDMLFSDFFVRVICFLEPVVPSIIKICCWLLAILQTCLYHYIFDDWGFWHFFCQNETILWMLNKECHCSVLQMKQPTGDVMASITFCDS
jgi:hypothetical protein